VAWRKWQFPLISLALCVAAYGLLIRGLGYYWDDWMIPTIIKNGMSFWTFYQYNRPLSAWTFELLRSILGLNPFGWHLANLVMRWVTGLLVDVDNALAQSTPRRRVDVVFVPDLTRVPAASFRGNVRSALFDLSFFLYLVRKHDADVTRWARTCGLWCAFALY
jgi:hypothetical protein